MSIPFRELMISLINFKEWVVSQRLMHDSVFHQVKAKVKEDKVTSAVFRARYGHWELLITLSGSASVL